MTRVPNHKGPLGQKAPKQAAKPRKALPKVSAKMKAHKAAERATGGTEHMLAVKGLPCICCGHPPPSEAHHVKDEGKRSNFRVIPLCQPCHTGPNGYHKAKKQWRARYGRDCDLLPRVDALLMK
jgi:hypothetical protein